VALEIDLSGRAVLVTGGTKGVGRGIAQRFADAGATVVVCARREPEHPLPDGWIFVPADLRDGEAAWAAVDAAKDAAGRLDCVVNNAGGSPPADSADASPRFSERIVALNLLAPLTFAQAVHDAMQAQEGGGVIVNIASVSGTRPNPMGAAYGAAKAGLINLTDTLAAEWGPKIRVLTLTVGLIVTEDAHLYYGDEEGIKAVGDTIPARRMGNPDDIADVCLFLCSPLARWMTGTNVFVHGGGELPAYLGASTGDVTKATAP
jgi:NAD(P)-dependent dehydrogenase (short-subunit alcohol dehydrogenase family)